jgi:hypothetical protein
MLNLISVLVGLVALVPALIAFIPLLGWMYWFIIPVAVVGFVIGLLSSGNAGRNLNLVVIVVGLVRLMIGHGIF